MMMIWEGALAFDHRSISHKGSRLRGEKEGGRSLLP